MARTVFPTTSPVLFRLATARSLDDFMTENAAVDDDVMDRNIRNSSRVDFVIIYLASSVELINTLYILYIMSCFVVSDE